MSSPANPGELIRGAAAAIPDRAGLVWVGGKDAVGFLDGLVSQNVAALEIGDSAAGLLLAPNGKLRAPLHLVRLADRVGLVCDAGRTEIVRDDLSRFKIRVDVAITVESGRIWEIWGPGGPDLVDRYSAAESGPPAIPRPFARSSLPRLVVVGDPPPCPRLRGADIEATRIEIGEPIMGVDLTDKTIPQEGVDVLRTVDFTKGCYLGQELVARIDSRGHVNQRLAGLVFDGIRVPDVPGEVVLDGESVGTITSAAQSARLAAPIGLGMIRVAAQSGATVRVGGSTATIVELPLVP